jgi:2-polyprenyl-6-methoxyphenol hydroxylase-like FAD-dependent oxidoreductase
MPTDHDGFLAYAQSLPAPDLHAAIRDLQPLSEIKRHRFVGSLRRRYERMREVPGGFIAIGDSVCSFNPIYGQGMTVAAIEAEALGEALTLAQAQGGLRPDFARAWFARIAPAVDAAWNGVLLEDFRFPELAAQRPSGMRPLQWYMRRVTRATHRSAYATDRFYRVMNFLAPPTTLFSPRMIFQALCAGSGPEPLAAPPAARDLPHPAPAIATAGEPD